jgi:uncharacterized repeat protein (TIGR01451 family)
MTKNLITNPCNRAASLLLGIVLLCGMNAPAATITTLYSFGAIDNNTYENADGWSLNGFIVGKDGSFYGTAQAGGANDAGTIFRITTNGAFTLLYTFNGGANSDGAYPHGLAMDANGNFYGLAASGANGTGTIFKLATDGTAAGTKFTTLYSFPSTATALAASPPVGTYPQGILALDGQGNFYGVTAGGGIATYRALGNGTIFKMTTDGTPNGTTLTTLHDFGTMDQNSAYDGAFPAYGMTLGSDGNLYGTTSFLVQVAEPTVFQMTPAGVLTTLNLFPLGSHGYPDPCCMLEGPAGIFNGIDRTDGDLGMGVLFNITSAGVFTNIYAFADPPFLVNNYAGTNFDGGNPLSWVKASDGTLYGVTSSYGANGQGTLFKLTTDGTPTGTVLTTLYVFSSPYDTIPLPEGGCTGIALAADGTLYGLLADGANNAGAIFRFNPTGVTVNTLPQTSVQIVGTITPGGPINFVANQSSTVSGLIVRIQYTTNTSMESSWTDLPDGNGGHLHLGATGTYSFGTIGTTFYPAGTKVYFRAIASAPGYADNISTQILGPLVLEQAQLAIGITLTTTSDPTGALQTAHIGDYLTNTLTWTNTGNAPAVNLQVTMPVPMYIDAATGAQLQFPSNTLVYNSYATYVRASSGAKNAAVVWNVSNLKPGYSQSVTLLEKLGPTVQVPSGIGLPNNYTVSSTSSQPPTPGEGPLGAPGVSVVGPISFTVVPQNTTIAPGGLLTYTFTLSNLTSVAVPHPVVAIVVPQYTRFATSYPNGTGKPVAGVTEFGNGLPGTTYKHIFYDNADQSLVLINFGALAADSSKTGLSSISFNVAFQAQWGIPSTVANIVSGDYLACFLAPAYYTRFLALYNAAGQTAATADTNDFTALLTQASPYIVLSKDQDQLITVPLAGSATGSPYLHLLKTLSAGISDIENDSSGKLVDAVLTNGLITFVLTAYNNGISDANDVFIEDTMPNSCAYVSNSLLFATLKPKSTPSTLSSATNGFTVVQDPDGHHLRFEGLRVKAGDNVSLEYTVRVFDGAPKSSRPAPAPLTFLDPAVAIDASGLPDPASIGSSTTYNTWVGTYLSQPIEVVSTNQFANPIIRALVPHPAASPNVSATAAILTAFYKQYPNSIPLTNASDPSSFYPGMERYYIHYQNNGRAVTGAKLDVPLPANTTFLRAAFVKLTPNVTPGTMPYLPGVIIPNPSGGSATGIILPTGTSDTVTFDLPTMAVGATGDVMVEVIITPGAVQKSGTLVGDPAASPVVIYPKSITKPRIKGSFKDIADPFQSFTGFRTQPVSAPTVPELGIMITAPQQVHPGDTFNISMTVYNYGDVDSYYSTINFVIPNNATYVSNDDAQAFQVPAPGQTAGFLMSAYLMSYNNPDPNVADLNPLKAHTATGLTVTLQAAGAVGSTISADTTTTAASTATTAAATNEIYLYGDDWGSLAPPPFSITIVDPSIPLSGGIQTYHTGVPLFQPVVEQTDVAIIDIGELNGIENIVASGAGNIVASGAGNIVASGAGNIVASGAGNIVASGAGNIVVWGPASAVPIGGQNGAYYLANQASIVASGAGNLIGPDESKIVASGAGNIVASGAGNLIAQDGSSIVASGAGNFSAVGTTIEVQSADNVELDGEGITAVANGGAIVSSGAGNLIANDGGSIKSRSVAGDAKAVSSASQTKGFILTSTPGSKVLIRTTAGNIFGAGGSVYAPNP